MEEPYVFAVTPSNISVIPEDTILIPAGTKARNGRIRKYPALPADVKPKTADVVRREIHDNGWQKIEWSKGTKGTLSGLFSRIRIRVVTDNRPSDETGWLLFERRKGVELKVYLCWGLDDIPIEELVKIAHIRWFAEQGFKQMKGELGLDEFEGRSWRGWHHHTAMVIVAFSYLILMRSGGYQIDEKLPTLPKVREEMSRLIVRKALVRKFKISPEEADAFLDDEPYIIPQ
jgi:SRSO17 transposase